MAITLPIALPGTVPPVGPIIPSWVSNEFQAAQYTLLVRQANLQARILAEQEIQTALLRQLVKSTVTNPQI